MNRKTNKKLLPAILLVILLVALCLVPVLGCAKEPAPVTTSIATPFAEVNNRLNAVESRVLALENKFQIGGTITEIQNEIVTIKAQLAALPTLNNNDNATRIATVEARVANLETKIGIIENAVADLEGKNDSQDAVIAKLQSDLAALTAKVNAIPTTPPTTTPPTTTPPTTTPLTAAEAIQMTLTPIASPANYLDVDQTSTNPQTFYMTLHIKNTSNQTFNNVKYLLNLYSDITSAQIKVGSFVVATAGGSNWIYTGSTGAGYSFMSIPANIPPSYEGEIIISVLLTLNAAIPTQGYMYPTISVI
jgi:uncharacterized coiled-coil protein SlyX